MADHRAGDRDDGRRVGRRRRRVGRRRGGWPARGEAAASGEDGRCVALAASGLVAAARGLTDRSEEKEAC
jgi:hypothetical protein